MDKLFVNQVGDVASSVITVAIIVAIAIVVSRALQWPVRRMLSADERRKVGGSIFQNIVYVVVWGWAACAIINALFDVDMAGIFGALGIVGIAVSLGAQQTIANVIGGIIVSLSNMVGPGDWIALPGHAEARVVDTNWRRTTLEDENGIQFAVPNSVMVSNVVEKGNPYFMIVIPFALKPGTPHIADFLLECEQVLLDRQVACGLDWQAMRPKAHVEGTGLGCIRAEVKIYANREHDSRYVKRAVLPALVDFLQERDALAQIEELG